MGQCNHMISYDDLRFEYFHINHLHIIFIITFYLIGILANFHTKLEKNQDKKAVLQSIFWPIYWFIILPFKCFIKVIHAGINIIVKMIKVCLK